MNILTALKSDHKELKKMLKDIEGTTERAVAISPPSPIAQQHPGCTMSFPPMEPQMALKQQIAGAMPRPLHSPVRAVE